MSVKTLQQWFIGTALVPRAGGRGFDPRLRNTKDVIKMEPDASLISTHHKRIGLAYLSSQT